MRLHKSKAFKFLLKDFSVNGFSLEKKTYVGFIFKGYVICLSFLNLKKQEKRIIQLTVIIVRDTLKLFY